MAPSARPGRLELPPGILVPIAMLGAAALLLGLFNQAIVTTSSRWPPGGDRSS
jgi:hypothetical protein